MEVALPGLITPHAPPAASQDADLVNMQNNVKMQVGSGWLTRRCFSENYPIKSPSLPCFHAPPPVIAAALSTKATDTSPNQVLSTLSNHRGHQVCLHVPAALAWVSGVPLWGCWEARKANQNLNIYTGTHRIVSGGAEPDWFGVLFVFCFPPPF